MHRFLFVILFFLICLQDFSQPGRSSGNTNNFLIPDTVCVNDPVTIINTSHGLASFYHWSFCTANAGTDPSGFPMISVPSFYNQPAFVALVEDNGEVYSFVSNSGNGTITRNEHHHNLMIPPATSVNLGNFSSANTIVTGIQVKKDNGNWYGFVLEENILLRLDFGNSLLNIPLFHLYSTIFDTTSLMNGLTIVKDGNDWTGFCTNIQGNSISRISWGNSLLNIPSVTDLGNVGSLNVPWQCAVTKKDSAWYILVANEGDNSLSRLNFGGSLMNVPTGANLGNIGALDHDRGILLLRECDALNGFVLNHTSSNDVLVRLHFPGEISGPVTGQSIGNIGILSQPSTFSELIRLGDTLYTLAANTGNSTISLLYFPSCTNSSIPSSNLEDPPPVSYSDPGNYNIMLVTDEGLPTQMNFCHRITVMPDISINIGNDTLLCSGKPITLDPGAGYIHYLWSNGDTTRTIRTKTAGKYWVRVVNRWNCEASDTIVLSRQPAVTSTIDTTICYGARFFAGGALQSNPGTYVDTLQTADGCDSVRITHLTVKPRIPLDLGGNRSICPGDKITLNASVAGATYTWQDASTDSVFVVTAPGTYWVEVTFNKCTVGDTVIITECPSELWFPTAFTPNGDGVNDFFRPKGISISRFHLEIFNRWGQLLFQTDDIERGWDGSSNGVLCPAGSYSFIATYEGTDNPGTTKKLRGSFILVR